MGYNNNILLDTLNARPVERPPVWVMRQAGRILPGYRKIRAEAGSFKRLVKAPDMIAEVTVEPLYELGVDAAILFSDILVIPEAMGVNYEIVEKVGPKFDTPIRQTSAIGQLRSGDDVLEHLDYVFNSIHKTKARMNGSHPLIGFAGAPWTLFAYMIEGGGSKTFAKARRFLYEHPEHSHDLLDKITDSTISYLKEKVACGVDVIQLFDSWAGMLTQQQYLEFSIPYCTRILEALEGIPRIFFPKGAWSSLPDMKDVPCEVFGMDWLTSADYVRSYLGAGKIVQGNLDPAHLYAPIPEIHKAVKSLIDNIGGRHIFNLGHGVYPDTDASHVREMIKAVKEYRYPS